MIAKVRHFLNDSRAAVAFETVLIMPILIWVYVGSFVFFDAYRVYNTSVKTTYMVADMLSRQTNVVFGHDLDGMTNVANTIIRGSDQLRMRVSQVGMVGGNYTIDWSHGTNGAARLFDANIDDIRDRLPDMGDGERVLLVESFILYEAPFNVGLTITEFQNFTLARPRYAGQVPFNATGTPPTS